MILSHPSNGTWKCLAARFVDTVVAQGDERGSGGQRRKEQDGRRKKRKIRKKEV
jgi:hypothetical protein